MAEPVEKCLFCRIAAGELPADRVYEVSGTDPVVTALIDAYLNAARGTREG